MSLDMQVIRCYGARKVEKDCCGKIKWLSSCLLYCTSVTSGKELVTALDMGIILKQSRITTIKGFLKLK